MIYLCSARHIKIKYETVYLLGQCFERIANKILRNHEYMCFSLRFYYFVVVRYIHLLTVYLKRHT